VRLLVAVLIFCDYIFGGKVVMRKMLIAFLLALVSCSLVVVMVGCGSQNQNSQAEVAVPDQAEAAGITDLVPLSSTFKKYVLDDAWHPHSESNSNYNVGRGLPRSEWGLAIDTEGKLHVPLFDTTTYIFGSDNGYLVDSWSGYPSLISRIAIDKRRSRMYAIRVFVGDRGGMYSEVRVYSISSTRSPRLLTTWASTDFSVGPSKIAVDESSGNIYVANRTEIRKLNSNGRVLLSWKRYGRGSTVDIEVKDLAVDSLGNVYAITDTTLYKYNSSGGYLMDRAVNGGTATAIAIDSLDKIFVAVSPATGGATDFIAKYNSDGIFLNTFGSGHLVSVRGVVFDETKKVYVRDYNGLHCFKLVFMTSGSKG